ncbi:Transmembrane protein 19 [Phytophthora pseudosyringae]|uniref:Transmembrane protein 19 n=1 Tax=Phytophthora pseudosyringae TaxID=221518 RepID=A0A8T1VYD8_9STRA|nr:Transmembrane protein 19 [Phytophthora pseudosyringae]
MTDAASRTFIGSTMLPPVALTDDDAHEYRGIADESLCETSALYEDFLYERKQTLDSRRWKHVRTKGAMKVYRQRSGSSDTSFDPRLRRRSDVVSTTGILVATESEDAGPISSASSSTSSGSGDDEEDAVAPTVISLLDDGSQPRGRVEDPGDAQEVERVGFGRALYVVLMSTGFATSSRGERIGYSIAQSVSHPDLPELKHLGIVRASMSFCVLYRQQSDQIVESFAHAVIDPGGTVLSFFVLQQIANSILGMGAPIECAQGKKLRWYVHKTAAQEERDMESSNVFATHKSSSSSSSSISTEQTSTNRMTENDDPRSCAHCHKSIGKLFSTQSVECTVCHQVLYAQVLAVRMTLLLTLLVLMVSVCMQALQY